MQITRENTKKNALKFLDELQKNIVGWKCFYLKISIIKEKKDFSENLINKLIQIFGGVSEIQIFVFNDYDILITLKGSVPSVLNDIISSSFRNSSQELSKPFTFYDLEKSLEIIKSIVLDKNEAANDAAEENKAEINSSTSTIQNIDPELLKTIDERRKKLFSQIRILLAEGDNFSRRLIKNVLLKGCDVIEAETTEEAYAQYVNNTPHITFLDVSLQNSSSLDLLEKITSVDKKSFIVMLGTNAVIDSVTLALQKGAKGFITKPFPKEKIDEYLNQYRQIQQLYSSWG